MFHISKPELSRTSCSRLSPYLAWGNLSVREVFQEGKKVKTKSNTRHIGAFLSRLRWQAHFIQKFEMEHVMENASVNKGYHKLKYNQIIDLSVELSKAYIRSKARISHILVKGNMVSVRYAHYIKTIENPREEMLLAHFMVIWELKDNKLYKGYQMSQL